LKKLHETLKITDKTSNPFAEMAAHQCLGMAYIHIGSFAEALDEEDRSLEISTTLDYHYFSCWSHLFKSFSNLLNENNDQASNEADKALEFAELSGSLYQRAGCLAMKALMLNRTGRRDEAVPTSG